MPPTNPDTYLARCQASAAVVAAHSTRQSGHQPVVAGGLAWPPWGQTVCWPTGARTVPAYQKEDFEYKTKSKY